MAHDPPSAQTIIVIAVLIASVCVICWRMTLRLAAIAILALTIYGAAVVVEGLTHAERVDHATVVRHREFRYPKAIRLPHSHPVQSATTARPAR